MNFQYVDTNPQAMHDMSCTVLSVEPTKFSDTGKPYNKCRLQDTAGMCKDVKVRQGNNPAMTAEQVGQSLIFGVQWHLHEPTNKPWYMVFWQCPKPQENQTAPPSVPNTSPTAPSQQQAPSQNYQQSPQGHVPPPVVTPGQMQPPTTYAYPVTPETRESMDRHGALKCACRLMLGRSTDNPVVDTLSHALVFYDWLSTGNVAAAPVEKTPDSTGNIAPPPAEKTPDGPDAPF